MNDSPLNAADRCDRCGAQAYVLVGRLEDKKILLFCSHHGKQYKPALIASGFIVKEYDVPN